MIPFNIPCLSGKEEQYLKDVLSLKKFSGDGEYTKKCNEWFKTNYNCISLLTTSCTHSLEMSAFLANIQKDDEVIMPSFTFTSSANAFVVRGAKIVFVDIRPDTMNINEKLIEQVITKKTKAIVAVHYAGVSCEMDAILELAKKYNLFVIEDAAQGIMSRYNGILLGSIGHFGCFSFHETKNIQCGEGGAILINDEKFLERAEIIREKGTNRSKFWRGEVDKYTWVDEGSSYLLSELNAAMLLGQLENAESITKHRLNIWKKYYDSLIHLKDKGFVELPVIPVHCEHNGHIFYLKLKDENTRDDFITHLKNKGIMSVFHYIPLQSSPAGIKYGRFFGEDIFTTKESLRIVRLPMYNELNDSEQNFIIDSILEFFN